MPTTYTLSYDFGQLLNTAAPVALSAYVQTNLDQLDGSPLIASGEIRLGGGQLSFVDKTGVGSVSLVGSDSTDLNVPAGSLQYQVVASYTAPGKGGGKRTWLSGWFTLTANSDLSGLATTGTPTAPDPGTPASLVDFTPSGTLTAGDVQAALVELDGDVQTVDGKVADRVEVREAPLSPYRYGFVGDGVADDTAALQDAINAVPTGGSMRLPHTGNAKITAPLSITKAVEIRGTSREQQRILAVGCDGINVSAGVDGVRLLDFEIAAGSRYSTAANTFVGVNVDGTSADNPTEHLYRNIFCDGFHTAFRTRYLWSSRFEGVRSAFGLIGIDAYGKSVNNFVSNSRIGVEGVSGSRGIRLYGRESFTDATVVASEGWVISSTLTSGAEIAVDMVGVNHVYIGDCILDFCQLNGIRAVDNGTNFSNNIAVHDSYIAMNGAAGDAAIRLGNAISHAQVRHARIHHNELTVYGGAACARGIYVVGAQAKAIIEGNVITFFTTNDIWSAAAPDSIIRGNACLSTAPANNITTGTVPTLVSDNVGTVYRSGGTPGEHPYARDPLGHKVAKGTAAPLAGTWARGDRVVNALPTVGQPKAWVCTTAGTPGTWVSEGNL